MIKDKEKIVNKAIYNQSKRILCFSIATSGRGLSNKEVSFPKN